MSTVEPTPLGRWSPEDVARNIVNQLFDQIQGLTVEQRQRLNDPCELFATGLLTRWLAALDSGTRRDETERAEDTVRRFARRLCAVEAIHQPRHFDGDGYGWTICVEDRQTWPCATARAMEDVDDA